MTHRLTDLTVVVLILASVTLLVVETFLPEASLAADYCEQAGHVLTLAFVAELGLRLVAMPNRRRFLRVYWLDIIAVLPIARPLRILRVVRLLRLYRVGVLVNRRLLGLGEAFRSGRSEILAVGVVVLIVVLVGSVGINIAEGRSSSAFGTIEDSTWWSLYTLISGNPVTEVPRTFVGRLLGLVVVMGGVGFFATITGIISAGMTHRLSKGLEVGDMMLEDLRDHVLICGWNRIGLRILEAFKDDPELGHRPVVLVAEMPTAPQLPPGRVDAERFFFLSADATRLEVLKKAGAERASRAILLADKSMPRSDQDRDARTVLTALTLEKLNPKIYTCVELLNRDNQSHLTMAGVEEIVVPDEHAGSVMAAAVRNLGIVGLIDELLSPCLGNSIHKTSLPEAWIDKEVRWVHQILKEEHNAILLSVERVRGESRELHNNPAAGDKLCAGDELILVAAARPRLP